MAGIDLGADTDQDGGGQETTADTICGARAGGSKGVMALPIGVGTGAPEGYAPPPILTILSH